MFHHADLRIATFSWRRVAALGSSFSLHMAALALVALPLARPLPRAAEKIPQATLVLLPPPVTALPLPPDPLPLPHTHVVQRTKPPLATTPVAPSPTPVAVDPTPATAAPGTPFDPPDTDASPAGATRVLAYAAPLRLRYPQGALRQHLQGSVLLRVLVAADGSAQQVEIERSSGHTVLDTAARDAVKAARFRPVLKDGTAVPAWGLVPIEFRLDRA